MNAKNLLAAFFRNPAKYLSGGASYKSYVAYLNLGEGLTVTVVHNDVGEIVWTRDSPGRLFGILAGAFTENKTVVFLTADTVRTNTASGVFAGGAVSDVNTIQVDNYNNAGEKTDDLNICVEIRVYP